MSSICCGETLDVQPQSTLFICRKNLEDDLSRIDTLDQSQVELEEECGKLEESVRQDDDYE